MERLYVVCWQRGAPPLYHEHTCHLVHAWHGHHMSFGARMAWPSHVIWCTHGMAITCHLVHAWHSRRAGMTCVASFLWLCSCPDRTGRLPAVYISGVHMKTTTTDSDKHTGYKHSTPGNGIMQSPCMRDTCPVRNGISQLEWAAHQGLVSPKDVPFPDVEATVGQQRS